MNRNDPTCVMPPKVAKRSKEGVSNHDIADIFTCKHLQSDIFEEKIEKLLYKFGSAQ
jgi:hypothetical protein